MSEPHCPRPIFVCGCPRSGTTALFRALEKHPSLSPRTPQNKELTFFVEFFEGRSWFLYRKDELDSEFERRAVHFINDFIAERCAGPDGRYITGHPNTIYHIERILAHLPEARFLLLVRHPQETVWSQLCHPTAHVAGWRNPDGAPGDPITDDEVAGCAKTWKNAAGVLLNALSGTYGDSVLVVRHENLTEKPAEELERVLDFIGEPPSRRVKRALTGTLHYSSFARDRAKAITGLARFFKKRRAAVAAQVHMCRKVAQVAEPEMSRLGYESLAPPTDPENVEEESTNHPDKPALPTETGAASVVYTRLLDETGKEGGTYSVGQPVTLCVRVKAHQYIENLSVCFAVKNSWGTDLFGTNTFDRRVVIHPLDEGDETEARFAFIQPLRAARYRISVALSTVSRRDYLDSVLLQYIDNATEFVSTCSPDYPVHYLLDVSTDIHVV